MAFEQIKDFTGRYSRAGMVNVRMYQIYLGASICDLYPLNQEHLTAEIYFDAESNQMAILPLKSDVGHFRLTKAGEKARAICCRRLIIKYRLVPDEKYDCEIKDVDGERMIVFKVEREEAQDGT